MPHTQSSWWSAVRALVVTTEVVVDRPAGSAHPRYPETIYPLDYGYLAGTNGGDGSGIDVWLGSSGIREPCAAIVCIDQLKGEIETKLLLGCTEEEIELIYRFHSEGSQSALVLTPAVAI